jgi:hypothetical protein
MKLQLIDALKRQYVELTSFVCTLLSVKIKYNYKKIYKIQVNKHKSR